MTPRGDLQLSIGYWIVSHKQTLKTWWAISFLAIIAISLLWMLVFFTIFFGQDRKISDYMIRAANGTGSFLVTAFRPQALTIGQVAVVVRDTGHIDLVAELTNPNSTWAASAVTAHFTVNGAVIQKQQLFVNQSAHRPVIQLSVAVKDTTNVVAVLVVDDTTWERASAAELTESHFTTANVTTTESTVSVNGQSRVSVSVHADVTNTSVYNFYRVTVPVIFMSGNRVVGADQINIERWPTLTTRPIAVTLSYPVPEVSSVRIEPQVSRFDVTNTYR